MTLREITEFHRKITENYPEIGLAYTGSFGLCLEGYLNRLPNDVDIVLSEQAFDLLKQEGSNAVYGDEGDHYSLNMFGVKIDVFLDRGYDKKTIRVVNTNFTIVDASVTLEKKMEYIEKYIGLLKQRHSLSEQAFCALNKHIADLNIASKAKRSNLPF